MPPDEYCRKCDNSAYTNAAAKLALSGPANAARLFGQKVNAEQEIWEQLSSKIWMPFDENNGVMLEYEGYRAGTWWSLISYIVVLTCININASVPMVSCFVGNNFRALNLASKDLNCKEFIIKWVISSLSEPPNSYSPVPSCCYFFNLIVSSFYSFLSQIFRIRLIF